jgi:hypothetical protein
MGHERERARREVNGEPTTAAAAAGRRSRVEASYPTLARKLGPTAGEPSIHDAATVAIEHKDGGGPVDAGVAAQVGAHLGTDFSQVRVHSDPLAQEASAAMGARAFAHGGDVFLARGESGADLGLMAHELTHVAQQGAAGQRALQRKVEVGDSDTPAEHEADAVAAAVSSGAPPRSLLVDDGPVAPGQMLKSTFMAQLRAAVTAAADDELGPVYSAIGCPYIDQYFARYADRPAGEAEALLRRFAPGVGAARSAPDCIPAVVARVRQGVRHWRDTGQAPPEIAAAEPAAADAAAPVPTAQRAPDGRETLGSLESALGAGQAVDGATASRMSDRLGVDASAVRVHTGAVAAAKAAEVGAIAFTVGNNVVLGADAPSAGTLAGDALLAHELVHTAQQADAARDPLARMLPLGAESAAAEHDADEHLRAAASGDRASLARRFLDAAKTGLQLQRCPGGSREPAREQTPERAPESGAPVDPAVAHRAAAAALVDIGGTADETDRQLVITAMLRIPLPGLQALAAANKRVVVCRGSVTEIRTDLRGVRPRGWREGQTWDTVPGLNDPTNNRVIIATRNGAIPATGEGHNASDLVLHEVGHAIDDSVGGGSNEQAFQDARTADLAALGPYFRQAGTAGLRETYAESFARFYANDPADAATYPHLHAYWAADPLGRYMRSRGTR